MPYPCFSHQARVDGRYEDGVALRTLKAFQYVTSHEGEVCPADWEEGEDTMQADPAGMREFLSTHN